MKYEVEVIKTVTQVFRATVTVEGKDMDEALELGEDLASTLRIEEWSRDLSGDDPLSTTFLADRIWEVA